jgi:hypothetical protein
VTLGFDVLNSVTAALRKAATLSLIVQTGWPTVHRQKNDNLIWKKWWARQGLNL